MSPSPLKNAGLNPHKSKKRKHVGEDEPTPKKKQKSKQVALPAQQDEPEKLATRKSKKPEKARERSPSPIPAPPRKSTKKSKKSKPRTPSPVQESSSSDRNSSSPSPEYSDTTSSSTTSVPRGPLQNGALEALSPSAVSQEFSGSDVDQNITTTTLDLLSSPSPSPFNSVRLSLYLALPAIGLQPKTALPSLLAKYLAPLILTYYAPAGGIILGFSDPVITAKKPTSDPSLNPFDPATPSEHQTIVYCGDTHGASYGWLTCTFLTFCPQRGQELIGYINVVSEGFVGLVSYNYFQVSTSQNRIPKEWRWNAPGGDMAAAMKRKAKNVRKKKIRDLEGSHSGGDPDAMDIDEQHELEAANAEEEDEEDGAGFFTDASGKRVSALQKYRVVDTEVVPGHDRDKWSLQIEGTLLNDEDEARAVKEERLKWEKMKNAATSGRRERRAGTAQQLALMSGGLGTSSF